jgi:transcriptional regulator with GAF, ATPase, and Fis domain
MNLHEQGYRADMAHLRVVTRDGKKKEVELAEEVTTIGRSAENIVDLADALLSRFHCHIRRTDSGYELVDLGSKNGTYVGGWMVTRKILRHGDRIEIGKTILEFNAPETRTGHETGDYKAAVDTMDRPTELLERPCVSMAPTPREEQLLKLLEINKALNSEHNLRRLLQRIMDTVLEVVKAERGFLIMFDNGGMEVKVSRNLDRESVPKPLLKFSSSIASQVRKSGKALVAVDAQSDKRFQETLSVHGLKLRSVLCVPLKVHAHMLGVVYVDNRFERGAFTENDVKLLEILSDQAAVAIENARLFGENLLKQKELEKSKREVEKLNRELKRRVERQLAELEQARTIIEGRKSSFKYNYDEMITRSKAMYEIFSRLDKITDSDIAVLIQGESGTGKELVARAIHFNGPRKVKRFVAQNCSAIPSELVESEFFGYVRGAFTGAIRDKQGLFEVADKGTIFLDEIADLPLLMQSKFLRVLEEGEIRHVGGKKTAMVDVRIISATNRDLAEAVRQGLFREDLYYRLNVITVDLPPLRERKEDIPLLIDHFLTKIAKRTKHKKRRLDTEALQLFEEYDWPGNIRELENEVERAAMLSDDVITPAHLSEQLRYRTAPKTLPPGAITGVLTEDDLEGKSLRDVMEVAAEKAERAAIVRALKKASGEKKEAARILDISRPTLYAKLKRYNIKPPK